MKDYSKKQDTFDEERVKSELDNLFAIIRSYRSSKHYKELLDFCSRFKHLAPFNALLVEMQRPSCRYVLTANEWKRKYNRRIIPDARPLVILSFQPVSFIYEIADTEPIDNTSTKTEKILEELKHQYDTKQKVRARDISLLIENLNSVGIAYNGNLDAGTEYAAKIEGLSSPIKIDVYNKKNKKNKNKNNNYIPYKAYYKISVNNRLDEGARFASILHELGHFFCHHIGNLWWESRSLPKDVEEFEAESVAWLVCERLNIQNPSEKYLADYLDKNENIPDGISIDHIFNAHKEIWNLLFEIQTAKKSFLYKHDKRFKALIDSSETNHHLLNMDKYEQLSLEFSER